MDRVFQVMGSAPGSIQVTFNGVTIRNGGSIIQAAPTTPDGGGIMIHNAHLRLVDSAVIGNHAAGHGGGISNTGQTGSGGTGSVVLIRSAVNRNTAGGDGGGIYLGGSTLTLVDSALRRNYSGHSGGGIYADFTTLTDSRMTGNVAAEEGGGIYAYNTATPDHQQSPRQYRTQYDRLRRRSCDDACVPEPIHSQRQCRGPRSRCRTGGRQLRIRGSGRR